MARVLECQKSFQFTSVIRGYHVYKDHWQAEIDDELQCEIEEANEHDKNAVAILQNGNVVGHIPRENSKVSKFFMQRGGFITCTVTGKRQNKNVGLEIPAIYTYNGNKKDTSNLSRLLKKL